MRTMHRAPRVSKITVHKKKLLLGFILLPGNRPRGAHAITPLVGSLEIGTEQSPNGGIPALVAT